MSSEVGDCILSRHYDPESMRDVLHVEKADPVAWISDEMLHNLSVSGNASNLLAHSPRGDGLFDGPCEGGNEPCVAGLGPNLLDAGVDLGGEDVG